MGGCNCLHRRSVAECHAVRFCASCKLCIRHKFQYLSHTGRIVSAHTSRERLTRLRHPGGTHGCRGVFGWKQQSRSASDASFRRSCPRSFNWRRLIWHSNVSTLASRNMAALLIRETYAALLFRILRRQGVCKYSRCRKSDGRIANKCSPQIAFDTTSEKYRSIFFFTDCHTSLC